MKDLIVLVADGQMKAAIEKLLTREHSFGISKPSFEVFVHPERDPGVFGKCQDFLRPFHQFYRFALVMFDREGCGSNEPTQAIQETLKERLDESGWKGRHQVVVLDPELEIWVWADSTNVAKILGLSQKQLQKILAKHKRNANLKPKDPKAAMEDALKKSRLPRSSAIYARLASSVTLKNCKDKSFGDLKSALVSWFGLQEQ
jgi:hypothetical protein